MMYEVSVGKRESHRQPHTDNAVDGNAASKSTELLRLTSSKEPDQPHVMLSGLPTCNERLWLVNKKSCPHTWMVGRGRRRIECAHNSNRRGGFRRRPDPDHCRTTTVAVVVVVLIRPPSRRLLSPLVGHVGAIDQVADQSANGLDPLLPSAPIGGSGVFLS